MADLAADRISMLELDIDIRTADIWAETQDFEDNALGDLGVLGAFMRAAYGRGYYDALRDGGQLLEDHGYARP